MKTSLSLKSLLLCILATLSSGFSPKPIMRQVSHATAAAGTFLMINAPLVARALEEDDDYVYGAVNAPGGLSLAIGGGVLITLTALLPLALQGGEEAFEEIREREADTFGKRNTDVLKKRR